MGDEGEPKSVFIFFDENMPTVENKTLAGLMNSRQCKISAISFPSRLKGKSDFEVTSWMKQAISVGWYQIDKSFLEAQNPVFIFCTTDLSFTEDARGELVAEQAQQKKDFGFVFLKESVICFKSEEKFIHIHVCRIRLERKRQKTILINTMIQEVLKVLVCYP